MYLGHWENPRKPGDERIYVNKVGLGLPKSSVYYQKGAAGNPVLTIVGDVDDKTIVEDKVREYLFEQGFLDEKEAFFKWDELVDFAEKQKKEYSKPTNSSKRKASALRGRKKKASTRNVSERGLEAMELDIETIPFPERVLIRVDHREPNEMVERLCEHPMIDVQVEALLVGDIEIQGKDGNAIVIERKDCSPRDGQTDFSASVTGDDKRLFNQSERMKVAEGVIPFFVLEGDVYANSANMLIQQIDGALSYLSVVQNMNTLLSYNLEHTVYLTLKLASHLNFGLGYLPALRPQKPSELDAGRAFVLEGVPGVSPELARRLLSEFGTVKGVACASVEQLVLIDGVGPKRAISIYNTLN